MTNGYPFSLSSEEFKDKRILVTGGTKGVGTRSAGSSVSRKKTTASPNIR
jgi:FlaA1/EpsC-like NDP-sugar epimerase